MRKEKVTTKEYIKLLEEHFDLMRPFKKTHIDERLDDIEKSIAAHREKFSVKNPRVAVVSVLAFGLLSSLAMGVTIILVTNEILGFRVAYSFKNIFALSTVFIISKTKLKFFENS